MNEVVETEGKDTHVYPLRLERTEFNIIKGFAGQTGVTIKELILGSINHCMEDDCPLFEG